MQLIIKNLKKSYGDNDILKNINLSLEFGEKIAIVGENGCGKSTLLKIVAGEESFDGGSLFLDKNINLGFLNQNAIESFNPKKDFELINPKFFSFLKVSSEIDFHKNLSGGEITKLSLCKLLSLEPSILLLDEPTNNIDFDGIKTLIKILENYFGTLVVVSHDRYFLDNLVYKVMEISNGNSKEYLGNYSDFRTQKKSLFEEALHRYEEDRKSQKKIEDSIKKTKLWSEKAHRDSTKYDSSGLKMGVKEKKRAKAKKMDKKIKSDIKRKEKLVKESEERPIEEKNIYFQINNAGSHGKRVLEAISIEKNYNNKILFKESSFTIQRGEKVAVFGPNGCGKTTLLKIIEGVEKLTKGEIWKSPSLKTYVMEQNFDSLDKNLTVKNYFDNLLGKLNGEHRKVLFNLGIKSNHINQKIGTLSFGEQMKLKIAEPVLCNSNFIILDEPTNHIDVNTREMLQNTLYNYNGTLILISHDINLLSKVCDKVLLFKNEKIIKLEDSFEEYFNKL